MLLVDDEILPLNAFKKRVDWLKYGFSDVFTAQDAASAKEILQAHRPELVISDIEMPGESGLELIKYIAEEYPGTETLVLTCHADFSYIKRSMKVRARDYVLKPVDYEELDEILQKFIEDQKQSQERRKMEYLVQDTEKMRRENDETRIDQVRAYIDEHLGEKMYVEDLAGLVHINEQYLMRLFKKETGLPVTEYITKQRIQMASTLLKETDKSVSFISDCVGFQDYSYFTKMFKKYTGLTPKEYRHEFKKE